MLILLTMMNLLLQPCLFLALFFPAAFTLLAPVSSSSSTSHAISESHYEDFVVYIKHSCATYAVLAVLPSPVGRMLVRPFELGHMQGFIARDKKREEIVVSCTPALGLPPLRSKIG
ncbi:hypothetical protein B0H13DRAFT_2269545 [Mycena leptocephala]|nr:hypothetical protein B0H13DRAFT_2269545 [Mycena leptocephala]